MSLSRKAFPKEFISLADIYVAYRKAKSEAFYDGMHPTAIDFTKYEKNITNNLRKLHADICSSDPKWYADVNKIGGYLYVPKSIDESKWDGFSEVHFRAVDPIADWEHRFVSSGNKKLYAKYRLIITPTVEFQIISALWIIKAGHLYEEKLDKQLSYGNRLRRSEPHMFAQPSENGVLNTDSMGLFTPYFSAYQKWRENGLSAMRDSIKNGASISAVTMDIAGFYHNVSPSFITRKGFLDRLSVELAPEQKLFTNQLLEAIDRWYATTPDYKERPDGALPVGLSASKVISNVLLHQLDYEVKRHVAPIYYGRYVDDIFLVINTPESATSGKQLIRWLSKSIPCLKFKRGSETELRLDIASASDSDLFFTASKQKIFSLSSEHGLDLVGQIASQIRAQSSEYRLLPHVPETASEMASKALLATPDASLAADALRKADVVTVRRLGFSLLLKDVEHYSTDLSSDSWVDTRREFYNLVQRHLLTPKGIFDYSNYLQRVFGLMIANRDFHEAQGFINSLINCFVILDKTTAPLGGRDKYTLCQVYFIKSFVQSATQASTTKDFDKFRELGSVLRKLFKFNATYHIANTQPSLKRLSKELLLADWGNRPYKDFWYYSQTQGINIIRPPRTLSVKRVIRLGAIRRFRDDTELKVPHWPALAFPTRPLTLQEIALINPNVLENPHLFKSSIKGLRGAGVWHFSRIGFSDHDDGKRFTVPHKRRNKIIVSLTNVKTTKNQWKGAAKGRPERSLNRYTQLCSLINNILKDPVKPHYVVFPELSIPRRWAIGFASKLAKQDISFLCGTEYYKHKKSSRILRNDSLISLTTMWPGYRANIVYMQPKLKPSHGEKEELSDIRKQQYEPSSGVKSLPIYNHGEFYFGVLICSDLTTPENRVRFQGKVDSLFVQEWNPDVKTFSFLVEGAAHDIHTFVVQVNNRLYGDSRIRAPYRADYLRDTVRVKGGLSDYFVTGSIDYLALRKFQKLNNMTNKESTFKPVPIGFVMADERKNWREN